VTVDLSKYIALSEAANRLGKSEQQIRTLCRKGLLRDARLLGRHLVERDSVEAYALPTTIPTA
jgi:hypothetical protein